MDRAPPKLPNTSSRLIAMAVSLVGEAEAVRKVMRCSHDDFRDYCASEKELPWPELDRLVGLIISEQGKMIARNRQFLKAARNKRGQPRNYFEAGPKPPVSED